ncbi:MAG: hypothetical protein J2P21_18135 [Chloracidobacterium sp.]|nr:hypothetical protein [Chloracidobacterium sp.]
MIDDQDKSRKFYDDTQTALARAGAILILLGPLTGGYVSFGDDRSDTVRRRRRARLAPERNPGRFLDIRGHLDRS